MRALRIWAGVAFAVLVAGCGSGPNAPRIDDPDFVRRAERICAERLPPLRADLSDDDPRQPAEIAPVVRERAESLEALVGTLEALPVEPGARPRLDEWFSDWATYVDVGRRYADALIEGDPKRYADVAEQGMAPQARISAFARANGFKACALDGVPLPPREGL